MEKQVLAVLTEVLEEQKETTRLLTGLNSSLSAMQAKLENLEAKVANDRTENIQFPISRPDDQLVKEIKEMKMWLAKLPMNVRHEKRLLLFPEHNPREYYSVVLRWLLFIIIATYAYWVFKYLIQAFLVYEGTS